MSFLRKLLADSINLFGTTRKSPCNPRLRKPTRKRFELLERRDLLAVSIIDDGDSGYSSFVPEVIIDNGGPGYSESGTWATSGLPNGYLGDSRYAYNRAGTAKYAFDRLDESYYELWVRTPGHENSTTSAQYKIENGSTTKYATLNQVNGTSGPDGWQMLGTYQATNAHLTVSLSNANTTGVLRADAIKAVPVFPVWRDSSLGGHESDSDYSYRGQAEYRFTDLAAGSNKLEVLIPSHLYSTTNATYKVYDGPASTGTPIAEFTNINQRTIGGSWHTLGNVTVTNSYLTITVENGTTSGAVRADAIRVSSYHPTGEIDFASPAVTDANEQDPGATLIVGQTGKLELRELKKDSTGGQFYVKFDSTKVKLYTDPGLAAADEYQSQTIFTSDDDLDLWFKSIAPGNSDIELFTKRDSGATAMRLDWVNMKSVVAPTVDLDGDANNDGNLQTDNSAQDLDDPVEMDNPGVVIRLNDNDTDGNGVEDRLQQGPYGEADLGKLQIGGSFRNFDWAALGTNAQYELVIESLDTNIRLYDSANKANRIAVNGQQRWDLTQQNPNILDRIYVEGYQTGTATVKLQLYRKGDGGNIAEDSVRVTVGSLDLAVNSLSEAYEMTTGTIVWVNNDFSRQMPRPNTLLQGGLQSYLPDNSATSIVDPEYQRDFTRAVVTMSQNLVPYFDFELIASGAVRLWTQVAGLGLQESSTEGWFQIPLEYTISVNSSSFEFWIEGLAESASFAADMITARLVNRENSFIDNRFNDNVKYSVVDVNIGVDGDRNNQIDYTNSYDKQLTFWYNNDNDGEDQSNGGTVVNYLTDLDTNSQNDFDSNDYRVDNERDLEDFAAFDVYITDYLSNAYQSISELFILGGSGSVSLKFTKRQGAGLHDYLNKPTTAAEMSNAILKQVGNLSTEIETKSNKYIFEALSAAIDQNIDKLVSLGLRTIVTLPDGSSSVREKYVSLDLRDISKFYNTVSIDYLSQVGDNRFDTSFQDYTQLYIKNAATTANNPFLAGKDHIVAVHGWNNSINAKKQFGDTTFKRLYWQGFSGTLTSFEWPTFTDEVMSPVPGGPSIPTTFNSSEFQAWRSGKLLKSFLSGIVSADVNIHLIAHSMGNIVAGEAFRQWRDESNTPLVNTYIAMEASISSGAYGGPSTMSFQSDYDFYSNYPYGLNNGSNPYMNMNGLSLTSAKSPSQKWVNYYNPDDYATHFAWNLNNDFKGLDVWAQESGRWQYKYYVEADTFKLIRESKTTGIKTDIGTSFTTISTTSYKKIGPTTYEVMAFFAESNAPTVGTTSVTWFDKNLSIAPMMTGHGATDSRPNHSFQYNFSIEDTWQFWQTLILDCGMTPTS